MYNAPKNYWIILMMWKCWQELILKMKFLIEQETAENIISYLDEHNLTYRYCTNEGKGYLNRIDDKAHYLKTI